MATLSKNMKFAALMLVLMCLFNACKKSDSVGGETPPDLVSRVNASASGYVTNENNQPVQGATVKMGASTTTTDEFGFFDINNTSVIKNAAVITVQSAGYFKAIKTFAVETGRKHQTRIQLIPRVVIGTINATTGGVATAANGMKIELPAAGLVNATNGAAYTGNVQVAAHWIDPSSPELATTMPGDLRAINEQGLMRTLITYGMMKVELTGSGGERLQLAVGKKSKLTFPLPTTFIASAPSTIPLWYFDEEKGLWLEEGSATLNGNVYEGEVNHFSYWNCDIPANFVHFNTTVIDNNGNPVPMAHVIIRSQNNPYSTGYGYTDSSGYTSGFIPANSDLLIEVSFFNNCATPAYTQNFTTTASNLSLGTITLPPAVVASVSGTLTNCNAQPVTNGAVVVQFSNGHFVRYPVDATGAYQFSTPLCGANVVASIIGIDASNQQQSNTSTHTLVSGNNNIGNIQACGTTTDQFINFTINGTAYSFSSPNDSVFMDLQSSSQMVIVRGLQLSGSHSLSMAIGWIDIALNSQQPMYYFHTTHIPDSTTNPSQNMWVNITEFGSIGEFVSGSFSGTFIGRPPNNTPYVVTCTFRVRRLF